MPIVDDGYTEALSAIDRAIQRAHQGLFRQGQLWTTRGGQYPAFRIVGLEEGARSSSGILVEDPDGLKLCASWLDVLVEDPELILELK